MINDVTDIDTSVQSNGHRPAAANEVIDALRRKPRTVLLFRGFAPAVVALVLIVLMLWLAPSVAPEHIVQRPVNQASTTTTLAPTSTTSTVTTTTVSS